ncbi:hypothetical protein K505DRAFT_150658 [Melanomma pulvis-pyrius CBS 109.77]|uniref:Uncharacterized protein n=1 Tax=Melanomma pulvis-pyrius CBS 109.77 TaxID=1314802 RepID=A0A6A6WQJ8_9PLEO|nr:hypothetical protein K505DRAFT_150658 [Melanomma pulvis-pyrius CBS 109.77]
MGSQRSSMLNMPIPTTGPRPPRRVQDTNYLQPTRRLTRWHGAVLRQQSCRSFWRRMAIARLTRRQLATGKATRDTGLSPQRGPSAKSNDCLFGSGELVLGSGRLLGFRSRRSGLKIGDAAAEARVPLPPPPRGGEGLFCCFRTCPRWLWGLRGPPPELGRICWVLGPPAASVLSGRAEMAGVVTNTPVGGTSRLRQRVGIVITALFC